MTKKSKALLILTSTVLLSSILSSCGKREVQEVERVEPLINEFLLKSSDIKKDRDNMHSDGDNRASALKEADKKSTNNQIPDVNIAEIDIVGEDNSRFYEVIDNCDIKYGNVTYKNLYKAIKGTRRPSSDNNMINFIIKTYDPKGDTVICNYISEDDPDTLVGISQSLSHDLSTNWKGYSLIKNKYGSDVRWMIMLYEMDTLDRRATLYGCKDYMLYAGSNEVMEVNMSAYRTIGPESVID